MGGTNAQSCPTALRPRGRAQASFVRYAIFYTPQPGTPLASFGRSWFGRANDGVTLQAFSAAGLTGSGFARPPSTPSRYNGLHAVFKSPFCCATAWAPTR